MKLRKNWRLGFLCLLCVATLQARTTLAQDQSPDDAGNAGAQQGAETATPAGDDARGSAPLPAAVPVGAVPKELNILGPVLGTSGPLRWGPISVTQIGLLGVVDSFRPTDGAAFSDTLGFLGGVIAFDKYIKQSRLLLLYSPELVYLDGEFQKNSASNNSFNLGFNIVHRPRLTITLADAFNSVQSNQLHIDQILQTDYKTGLVLQGQFLDYAGSYLDDTLEAVINYSFSGRTTLTMIPRYRYAKATNAQANYGANGQFVEDQVSLTHAMTPKISLGATYIFGYLQGNNVTFLTTYYHTMGLEYAQQLSATWWFHAMIGGEVTTPAQAAPGMAATATLYKAFRNANLAIAYQRGHAYTGYLTSKNSDRVDATFSYNITRRLTLAAGAGDYRELGAPPLTNGNYATAGWAYLLGHGLALTGDYNHQFQNSTDPDLLSGTRDIYFAGLRWTPNNVVAHY